MPTVSDSDISSEVDGYQARMTPLAKALARLQSKAVEGLASDIKDMMAEGFYNPKDTAVFLNGRADSKTVQRIAELARSAPGTTGQATWERVLAQMAKGTLTRRRAIRHLAVLNAYSVLDDMLQTTARVLTGVAEDGYYRSIFTLQKQTGRGFAVDKLKGGRTQIIVRSAFSASDAKRFIDPLADMSSKAAVDAMLRGLAPDEAVKEVEDVKGAALFRSKRQARTVITETASEAHLSAYKEHGVDKYQFVATYDERTCPVCGRLDGQIFERSQAQAGINYPPMHPNCRCTTTAWFDDPDLDEDEDRELLVDKKTMTYVKIPAGFTYRDWYNQYGPGKDGKKFDE